MNSFLSKVREEILKSTDINNIEIIVPNNRTKLFLKNEIINNINFNSWMPKITPIQDIFKNNSDLIIADDVALIFFLHKIYLKHTNNEENLDDFYHWGEIILNDFDDIDKYLVDPKRIFENIKNIHEIENNFNEFSIEEIEIIKRFWTNLNYGIDVNDRAYIHRDKFLEFWDKLFYIYSDFTEKLISEGQVYQGLLYRQLINNLSIDYFNKDEYFIVGFNALNNCEKKLFDFLKKHKKTKFFWDLDDYYLLNNEQEAGLFLRDLIKKFPMQKKIIVEKNIVNNKREIEIIEVPSPIAQLKLIANILNEWKKAKDYIPEKTAIILADENTLIPLLYSIPEDFYPYNVSMGYPIKSSACFSFLNYVLDLNVNAKSQNNDIIYKTKDVINILNHFFIKNLNLIDNDTIQEIIIKFQLSISSTDLLTKLKNEKLFSLIFKTNDNDTISFPSYLLSIFEELMNIIINDDNMNIESEFVYKIKTQINSIFNTLENEKITLNTKIIIKLLRNIIYKMKIPFEGEPLKGIQIMGFIETRNIDFDRVIMLSLNENIFPHKNAPQSIIPYALRKGYGLPSIEFQDSIFAYYFYRILQNAKHVKMFYCSTIAEQNSEKSRFITQIQNELIFNSNTKIFNSNKGYNIKINSINDIIIKKQSEMLQNLINKKNDLSFSFHPTQINTYLKCKLQFYFKYIEKLKKPYDFEEDISKNFGSIFHEIIKLLYSPYIGKEIYSDDYNIIVNNIVSATYQSIRKVFSLEKENEIKNFEKKIFINIVKKYIENVLKYDKKHLPLKIIALEANNYSSNIIVNNKKIILTGIIDRIDFIDGKFRVIDYKTGNSHKDNFNIDKIFLQDRDYSYDTNLQILVYSHILFNNNFKNITPGIFELKSISTTDYNYHIGKTSIKSNYILDKYNSGIDDIVKEKLSFIINEILDINNNFTQTTFKNNCNNCDYKNICDR